MKIYNMKTCHVKNPLGFHIEKPGFTWAICETDAKKSEYNRVIVSENGDMTNPIHNSKPSNEISSLGYYPEISLKPYTRYYWNVEAAADNGDKAEGKAWFETAKMNEPWLAKWIGPKLSEKNLSPLLRREFNVTGEIVKARAYACGLGLYELYINGEKAGDEYFTPGMNAYDKWIQYQTYDITGILKTGENAAAAMLGNGWYKGRFGFSGNKGNIYGDSFAFLCEIHIYYADGTKEIICTDENWKTDKSPIIFNNIYDGEYYEANLEQNGFSQAGFDDSRWQEVSEINIGYERLEARRGLPIIIKEEIKPVEIIKTPAGETVLDMGQNMVGILKYRVNEPAGSEIRVSFGEVLQDGNFYRDNLRTAQARHTYISNGKPAIVKQHFTFYGFRFVKVEGISEIRPEDFTGCVIYSDLDRTGEIKTSDPLVNKLFLNALWGQKGNFLDIPTDCPQRDERMGWTGDAQVFSGTACYNMDSYTFFSKWLYDLSREQEKTGGAVPHVVPVTALNSKDHLASSAWGDAATVIPWNMYMIYGDRAILEQQFESMRAWVDYIKKEDDSSGSQRLWNTGFHYGDWLALDGPPKSNFGGTRTEYISSAYYAYSAGLVAKAAKVLGKDELSSEYSALSEEIKQAIRREYFSPAGRLSVDTQTGYTLALFMDLAREEDRKLAADILNNKIISNRSYLNTGFVGTPYLCRVLSENNYNETAYTLLLNRECPSWLYEVIMGATTIWERWNSLSPEGKITDIRMNSLNHYAYGSIVEWMYRNMCGINPSENSPGFKHAILRPQPDSRLKYASASVETAAGRYELSWKIMDNGTTEYVVTVPYDCTADLILYKGEEVFERKLDAGTVKIVI